MKNKIALLTLVVICSLTRLDSAFGQIGTAFTYQGQLQTSNGPAHGLYNFTFALYNASSGGTQTGSTVQTNGVSVTNGLFTVVIDFGSVFSSSTAFWLQIGVETNGAASFSALSPRQGLTPVPYANTAENLNGTLLASQLTGTLPGGLLSGIYGNSVTLNNPADVFDGNGAGLTDVNALTLDGLGAANFWQLTGNAGTTAGTDFVGTTDNQPLELHVDGQRALRLVPDTTSGFVSPNVIGGSSGNFVASGVYAATIGGGGGISGFGNSVSNSFGTVAGGVENSSGQQATVGGGFLNNASGLNAVVGGGYDNSASGAEATVPGGFGNVAQGNSSFAAGEDAQALHNNAFVWSDGSAPFSSTAPNQFLILASAGVGIGTFNGPQQFLSVHGGLNVDQANDNAGFLNNGNTNGYGLTFGSSSGEGIASQRTAGTNQYSLDFYTAFNNRMTIMNGGFVGINTTNPLAQLHVVKGTPTGASDAYDGYPAIFADISSGDGVYINDTDSDGFAVWANATSGIGVDAYASTGTAVSADTSSGTGVYAYSGSGSALTIAGGAVHITNSGTNSTATAAFIWVATAANTSGNLTIINNSLCNGDPNAILLVTPNLTPQGTRTVYVNHPIGVYYDGSNWGVFNQDVAPMAAGSAFNVLIIKD